MMFAPPSPDQEQLLSRWRAVALQRMPYFATLLFAVRPCHAPGLGTFAVDEQWRLYIDFDAVTARGETWCAESLLHECGHLYGQHAARTREFLGDHHGDPAYRRAANVVTDLAVNDDLVDAGCATLSDVHPDRFGLPVHMTPEWYWKQLERNVTTSGDGGGGADQGDGSGPGGQAPFSGCGQGAGGIPTPGTADGSPSTVPGVDSVEQAAALESTSFAVLHHHKSRGTVPAGLVTQAEHLLRPSTVPWQKLLAVSMRRAIAWRPGLEDSTYSRRNRRRPTTLLAPGRRAINPGWVRPVPNVIVVRDTSGSMSNDDLAAAVSEVEAISRKLGIRGDQLRVVDADTLLYQVKKYTGHRALTEVTGRGGTDMANAIIDASLLRPAPNVIVCITDGYTPWPQHRTRGVPVVACIVGGGGDPPPPWITTVEVAVGTP